MKIDEQNILFLTRTMDLGGTENVILQLCEIFKDRAHKIVVCSSGGLNENKLNFMGIKHYTIPDITDKNFFTMVKVVCSLIKIVKNEKITVIHTHHRMAAFYVAILHLYKKCIFINTCHNTFEDKVELTRLSYKHCHLIACGRTVKDNLIEKFRIPEKQISIVHNAVKPFDGKIKNDDFIQQLHDQGNIIVGNIGRLSEQKGMEYFIKAIPGIIKKCSNTKFVIVGVGEDEQKLKEISKKLKIEDCLFFLGYREDIQNLIAQLDLIVISSLWEGLPLTPIETFSTGKTIVATEVGGTAEIVTDKYNGLLVRKKNVGDLEAAVSNLIQDKCRRKQYEENALKTYKKKNSIKAFTENYLKKYTKI